MPPIKNVFKNIIGERVLSSYDYLDLVSGRAIQNMYLGSTRKTASGTETFIINENTFWSTSTNISGTLLNQATPTKIIDKDFDLNIDKQVIIGGDSTLSISYGWTGTNGFAHTYYVLGKIVHYDGSTETILATAKSTVLSGVDPANNIDTLLFDIPNTKFSSSDTLRIIIEGWATNEDAGHTATYRIGIDPKDRTVGGISSESSQMISMTPFKIDL